MHVLAAERVAYPELLPVSVAVAGLFLLSFQGLWLICRAIWPARVRIAAERVERHPKGCFILGAIITAVLFALVRALAHRRGMPGHIVGYILAFIYAMFVGVGTSGLATQIGRRLTSPADANRPWLATVRGGLALQLACLLPVFGWFGILGVSILTGVGAAALAAFSESGASVQGSSADEKSHAP